MRIAASKKDNFSIEELIEFVRARGATRDANLELTPEHVRERHAVGRKGLAEVLLAEAAAPDHGSVRVSKPELAEAMLEHLRNELSELGIDSCAERRPIIQPVRGILRVI